MTTTAESFDNSPGTQEGELRNGPTYIKDGKERRDVHVWKNGEWAFKRTETFSSSSKRGTSGWGYTED